jgi:pyruvate dehydrogenase E2 component (dihydrolipoamide acetyltransferase)
VPVQQVTVPDIGGAEGAEVIELLVAVGDKVALDQGLIVLESDKASMEIPSTVAGTIVELLVKEGDQLSEGAPVAMVEVAAEATAKPDAPPQESAEAAKESTAAKAPAKAGVGAVAQLAPDVPEELVPAAQPVATELQTAAHNTPGATTGTIDADDEDGAASAQVYAGPAVRKLAREFGVRLGKVAGSGPQGRILKEDLQQFVQKSLRESPQAAAGAGLPAVPEIDFAKFGEVETIQRSKLDKLTAANMHRSWLNVPHVTQFDEADISDLEAFRSGLKDEAKRRGTKLSPLPFVLKACAVALRDNPRLNSSLSRGGEDLVHKKYCHIGMAVDTPAGLVVPVLRDVERKTIWELALEIAALAERARERKLAPNEMQGGCFTVSSLGNIGGSGFTPIVNTPEVGILGVSKAAIKPVWNGSEFMPRTLLPLALSYDHRVVNGGDGGRFLTQVVALLSDIRQLIL